MHMVPGQEYFFFIYEEGEKQYICIECPQANEMKLSMEKVEEYLKSRGLKITPEN